MGGMGDSARGFFAVRPRTIIVCVIALTLTILVVHDDSRGAAHTALKKVGVPLPDSLDDVRSGISGMLGGNGKGTSIWLPHSKPSSSDSYYHDEGDLAGGIQWQNTTAEHSSTSWGSPDEPIIDKMTYHHSNGYLLLPDPSKANSVKPLSEERHPILELIENAERKWDKLLKSQSKTLAEAVAEYKRRYQRNPPRGFDKWCVQMLCFYCALLTGIMPGGTMPSSTTSSSKTNMTKSGAILRRFGLCEASVRSVPIHTELHSAENLMTSRIDLA